MFTQSWSTSQPVDGIVRDRDISIPLSDGVTLDCDIVRPDRPGRFPVLLGVHAYSKADQFTDLMPEGMSHKRGHMEAGDSAFFARRGYVHVVANIRGTGGSQGYFGNLDVRAITDIAEAVEWLAAQSWSSGKVAMTGVSYFSIVSQRVAALKPPSLKCIWAPYGWNEAYRDRYYHGGILSYGFMRGWLRNVANIRVSPELADAMRTPAMRDRIEQLKADPEIAPVEYLSDILKAPDQGTNPIMVEILAHQLDGEFWRQRSVDFTKNIDVPASFGGCWGIYGLHLPGAFRGFDKFAGPKRMLIGPPVYLDRPVYQYQYDQLRWFDLWLKDNDTGILDEPKVQLFVDGIGAWRDGDQWPSPEARWTRFYLHEEGLLSEREPFRGSDTSVLEDAPASHGELRFTTPPMVEATEICGPIALKLFASTTDNEALWFVSLFEIDPQGGDRLLTRGWLRGSQRALDPASSKPWLPYHTHAARDPLTPGEVTEFDIEVRPYALQLKPGYRLALRLKCADGEKPEHDLQWIAQGHLSRPKPATVTVHHSNAHPSHLLLPITKGNRIGTFMSGGVPRLSS
ncbi:MAG: CocE/NonD family hydrolase [Pseudolabrys sp.]|nr:CocE/NonD family hydrolase [Pseudolabrys sp.]